MSRDNAVSLKGERMLSVRETAKILGWCLDSVRRHLRAGDMPGTRIGRNWRVPESQLAAYMGLTQPIAPATPAPVTSSPTPTTQEAKMSSALPPEYQCEIVDTLLRTSAARAQVLQMVQSAMKNIDASPEVAQQTIREMGILLQKI